MILDVIAILYFLLAFVIGMKRGGVRSLQGIITWAATLLITVFAFAPTVNFLEGTEIAQKINQNVYTTISQKVDLSEGVENKTVANERTVLPKSVIEELGINEITSDITDDVLRKVTDNITGAVLRIIAVCVLVLLTKLILGIIFNALNFVTMLPGIHAANGILGGALSIVCALLAAYLVCGIASLLVSPSIYENINKTTIVKHLFDNNILLNLFINKSKFPFTFAVGGNS